MIPMTLLTSALLVALVARLVSTETIIVREYEKEGRRQIVTRKAKAKFKSHGIRFYYITDFNSIFAFLSNTDCSFYYIMRIFSGCSFYVNAAYNVPSNIKCVYSKGESMRKEKVDEKKGRRAILSSPFVSMDSTLPCCCCCNRSCWQAFSKIHIYIYIYVQYV